MALSPNTNHTDVADDEPVDHPDHKDMEQKPPVSMQRAAGLATGRVRDALPPPPHVVVDPDAALYVVCDGRVCRVFKAERRAVERRGGGGGVKRADRRASPSFVHRVTSVTVPTTVVPTAVLTRRTMPQPPVLAAEMSSIATRVRTRRRPEHHQGRAAGEMIVLLSSDED